MQVEHSVGTWLDGCWDYLELPVMKSSGLVKRFPVSLYYVFLDDLLVIVNQYSTVLYSCCIVSERFAVKMPPALKYSSRVMFKLV